MKRILFSLLSAGLVFAACGEKQNISGQLTGLDTDTLIVTVGLPHQQALRQDTVIAKDGKFAYYAPDSLAMNVSIEAARWNTRTDAPRISFLFYPGKNLAINGSFDEYTLDGDPFYKAYKAAKDYNNTLADPIKELVTKYKDGIKAGLNADSLYQIINEQIEPLQAKAFADALAYVKANGDKDEVVLLLDDVHPDSLEVAINAISPRVANSPLKSLIAPMQAYVDRQKEQAAKEAAVAPGMQAPDFTLKDVNGKDLSLSSLRGKYVVIDFWGKWCIWCMKGMPEMKKYYAKYKNKMEILGVDVRDTDEVWKKTVATEKLAWKHVKDAEAVNAPSLYAVQGYPTKVIIDPQGKIVKKFVGEDPAFYKQLDELLK